MGTDSRRAEWPENAERIIDAETVSRALDEQAARLARRLPADAPVSVVVLMNGGMYPAIKLTQRLSHPLLFEYAHVTRYRGGKVGGEIEWIHFPQSDRMTDHILLVDDIFDEGYTMSAVKDRLTQEGGKNVLSAVLAVKQHERGLPRDWVDDYALTVPDRYVYGCGMDLHGYWRQLDEIWAI